MFPSLQLLTYGASYSNYTFKFSYYFDEIRALKLKGADSFQQLEFVRKVITPVFGSGIYFVRTCRYSVWLVLL
jgi:hypothetical protein